jgi:hypothetical protein
MDTTTWSKVWAQLREWRWQLLPVAGFVLIALAAVLDALPRRTTARPGRGAIHVASPEINTRERLVNDRYEQDAWLRDELRKAQMSPSGSQGVFSSSSRQSHSLGAAVGTTLPTLPDLDAGLPAATPTTGDPRPSPIDDFHDRAAFLEEIRAELLENQLDDRHDLGGNTVYRLKFDCTVIPAAHNDSSAVVEVHVQKIGREKTSDELETEAGDDLYTAWLRGIFATARATFTKRLGDLRTALSLAAQDPRHLPTDSGVNADLARIAQSLASPREGCPSGEPVTDLLCRLKMNATAEEKDALVARKFAEYFAKERTDHFAGLAEFYESAGDLVMPMLNWVDSGRSPTGLDKATFARLFSKFKTLMNGDADDVYTYSVAPKESADRLALDAILESQAARGLAVAAPVSAATSTATLGDRRQSALHATFIERSPRVVGFSHSLAWAADFGWTIGARFGLPERADQAPRLEQQTAHYELSAIISAPAWWLRLPVQVLVYWFNPPTGVCSDEQGKPFLPCPPPDAWESVKNLVRTMYVRFPGDAHILTDVVERKLHQSADESKLPWIDEEAMQPARLEAGTRGDVVIPGEDLWRSPVVTLGQQQAKRIQILPNMNGLIATFEPVDPPAGWNGPEPYKDAKLTVWTSERYPASVVNKVQIYPARPVASASAAASAVAPALAPPK